MSEPQKSTAKAKQAESDADAGAMLPSKRWTVAAIAIVSLLLVGYVGIRLADNDGGDSDVAAADELEDSPSENSPSEDSPSEDSETPSVGDDADAEVAGSQQILGDGESNDGDETGSDDESDVNEADDGAVDGDAGDVGDVGDVGSAVDDVAVETEDIDETQLDVEDGTEVADIDDADPDDADPDDADPDDGESGSDEPAIEAEEVEVEKGPVTIAFGGDMHFERDLGVRLVNETDTMMDSVAEMMADADLAIANLETTVTDRGETTPGKAYNFRTSPEAFDAIRSSGIDVVSVANNHGMDFGLVGLEDTLAAAEEKDFPVIGAGMDADEAFAPYVAKINGQSIAVIGATQVLDNSVRLLWTATDDQPGLASAKEVDVIVEAVANARAEHDTVVVYLHWGIEGETCPAPRQLELSDQLIAAGADIIVGGHAHRLQAGGLKNGAFVHYGMGNFVFYKYEGPSTESGVLRVTIDGRTIEDYEWVPARLVGGVAAPTNSADDLADWNSRRGCTDLVE